MKKNGLDKCSGIPKSKAKKKITELGLAVEGPKHRQFREICENGFCFCADFSSQIDFTGKIKKYRLDNRLLIPNPKEKKYSSTR